MNPKNRIFHLVDRHNADEKTESRQQAAYQSWDNLYEKGILIPAHFYEEIYPKTAREALGDSRPLPFLKDCFQFALDQSEDGDFILWGNSDSILHPQIAEYVRFHCGVYGACSFFRTEFGSTSPSLECSPEDYARQGRGRHIGRDAFAFSRKWLVENWGEIPDAILAAAMWDIHMACLIRLGYGIKTTNANIGDQLFPAEPILGYCGHLSHHSAWNMTNPNQNPSNAHNGGLFKEFAAKYLPELKVTQEGNLA